MKQCSRCREVKNFSEFHIQRAKPDGRHAYCKECKRILNKERVDGRRRAWIKENGPCIDCGSWDNLQVDHKDAKTKDPRLKKGSGASIFSWSEEKRLVELVKCVVRCEECHKRKTFNNKEHARGEKVGSAKVTKTEVTYAINKYNTGKYTQKEIADELGVDKSTVWKWVRKVQWKHVEV